MTAWSLAYDTYAPAEEGQREAICTLGNGFFATRGAAPESRADGVHNPGTYAAGCYNRLRDEIGGHVVENESMVNLPNWLMLTFAIDEGPWFELDRAEVLSFGQELDLRRGILTRRMRVRDPVGRCTQLMQRRLVHMEQPHLAGLETTITALNWSGRLRVRSGVDGAVENTGVKRYRNLSGCHLTTVAAEPRGDDLLLLVAETTQSHIRVAVAARNRIVGNEPAGAPEWSVVREPDSVAHELAIDVVAGEQLTIEKIVALYTSRDRAVSEPSEAAVGELGQAGSFGSCWNGMYWRGHTFGSTSASTSPMAPGSATRHCKPSTSTCFTSSRPCRRTASTWMRAYQHAGCTARPTAGTCSGTSSSFFPFSRSAHPPSPEPHCATGIGDYPRRAKPPGTRDSPVLCIPGSQGATGAKTASGCT